MVVALGPMQSTDNLHTKVYVDERVLALNTERGSHADTALADVTTTDKTIDRR